MDTVRSETELETTDEARRIAWGARMIAEADAEIAAGLAVPALDVTAWLKTIGADHELPIPQPRR